MLIVIQYYNDKTLHMYLRKCDLNVDFEHEPGAVQPISLCHVISKLHVCQCMYTRLHDIQALDTGMSHGCSEEVIRKVTYVLPPKSRFGGQAVQMQNHTFI